MTSQQLSCRIRRQAFTQRLDYAQVRPNFGFSAINLPVQSKDKDVIVLSTGRSPEGLGGARPGWMSERRAGNADRKSAPCSPFQLGLS